VLNRPTDTEVAEAVPELAEVVEPGATVSVGGPVQSESVVVLAEWDDHDEAGAMVFGDVGLMGADADSERVADTTRRPRVRAAPRGLRVCAGYAGWGGGQLEAELEEGSWVVEPAVDEDVFGGGDLWA